MSADNRRFNASHEVGSSGRPAEAIDLGFAEWREEPHFPIIASKSPVEHYLLQAISEGRAIDIIYHGGSVPGGRRRVRPVELFRLTDSGSAYLTAFCESREAKRTFRVDKIWIEDVSPARAAAAGPKPSVKRGPKFEYRPLRQRWNAELAVPFPLLKWEEIEAFVQANKEALLWILTDWDGPAWINLAILSAMGGDFFAGLPFAALDLDEAMDSRHPLPEQLALRSTNCFIRFSSGKEVWRETGPKPGREFQKWFAALRAPGSSA
jgi:hypothetical protein